MERTVKGHTKAITDVDYSPSGGLMGEYKRGRRNGGVVRRVLSSLMSAWNGKVNKSGSVGSSGAAGDIEGRQQRGKVSALDLATLCCITTSKHNTTRERRDPGCNAEASGYITCWDVLNISGRSPRRRLYVGTGPNVTTHLPLDPIR